MAASRIADYALLSDCRGAALAGRDGSIDWLCLPRFDAPSSLGRLLDPGAGHFVVRPEGARTISRRYVPGTLVLETRFECDGGALVLTDAMALGGDREHALGTNAPGVLLRHARCVEGSVMLDVELAPRFEYGLVEPVLVAAPGGLVTRGGPVVIALSAPAGLVFEAGRASARQRLAAGQSASFALAQRATGDPLPEPPRGDAVVAGITDAVEGWLSWSAQHQRYEGPYRDEVLLAGRVLQALTYAPTGAIVAAPTTSLPETLHGPRNWDYRFAWLRDASLTLEALWVAACPDEAYRFFDFVASAATARLRSSRELPTVVGVGGEHDLTERELPHLAGYRDSRPVRIGNAAWSQRQLDVFGELLAAAHRLRDQLVSLDPFTRAFLADVADAAAVRWIEPDHGVWELRGCPRHFIHSKLYCWVALDRAISIADLLGRRDHVPAWSAARDELARAILLRGFSPRLGAFTQAFDVEDLDAAALLVSVTGFLPPDDPRVLGTIEAIGAHLTDARGLVRRYRNDDGLDGEEGAFLPCTFWLAHAQALAGRIDDAHATFERAAACANDLGLFSEEVDGATGELLGNFPQAFSHIALVNAAWAIAEAEERVRGRAA